MNHDPVVEEARAAGHAYVDSFKGDWKALIADLRRRSEEAERRTVSLPPEAPKPRPVPTRKVG